MPTTVPAAIPSDGFVTLKWVPAIANVSAPSLGTELNAASALALECYLKENFAPGADTTAVEDRRMCSKQVFNTAGTTTYTIEDIVATYDPQNAASLANKAYAALVPGTNGFLVARWGMDVDTALAAAQKVDIYPVTIANRIKMAPETNSQLKFKARIMVTGPVVTDVAIAA
jgi:hypothetical protein